MIFDELSDKVNDIQILVNARSRRQGVYFDLKERAKRAREAEDQDLARVLLAMLVLLEKEM